MEKGLIHIYTGDGKGKTTSALGLSFRCAGNGFRVSFVQFLKSSKSGELNACDKLSLLFKIYRFEKTRDFFWNLSDEEKDELKGEIKAAFDFCYDEAVNFKCDLLVMDEIICAINNNLIDENEVIKLLTNKNPCVEVVLTGRNAPKRLIEIADYVSEIVPIKHPIKKGVKARCGIEF